MNLVLTHYSEKNTDPLLLSWSSILEIYVNIRETQPAKLEISSKSRIFSSAQFIGAFQIAPHRKNKEV